MVFASDVAQSITTIKENNVVRHMGLTTTRSATAPESARGCNVDELTIRKLCIGAGRGSLHRLVRPMSGSTRLLVLEFLFFDRWNLLGLFLQGILLEAQEQSRIGDFSLRLRGSSNQFLNIPWREISVR
jgi:hypothetical protein